MPRIRKQCATKGEALAFERFLDDPEKSTPWREGNAAPGDQRRLLDLVELWFSLHGQSLNDGERRKSKLQSVSEALGNPVAKKPLARVAFLCLEFSDLKYLTSKSRPFSRRQSSQSLYS